MGALLFWPINWYIFNQVIIRSVKQQLQMKTANHCFPDPVGDVINLQTVFAEFTLQWYYKDLRRQTLTFETGKRRFLVFLHQFYKTRSLYLSEEVWVIVKSIVEDLQLLWRELCMAWSDKITLGMSSALMLTSFLSLCVIMQSFLEFDRGI